MNESGPVEIDPDIAQIQARQAGAASDIANAPLPATAFVASINGQGGNVIFQQGTVPVGIAVAFTSGPGTVSLSLSGIDTVATKKSNLSAVVAPAVTDDSGDGYAIGSQWIDTVLGDVYMAVDVTVGAAVWRKLN